jgi:CheY-like chemotaxis protein
MPVMDGYTASREIRKCEEKIKAQGSRLKADDPSSPDGFAAASREQKNEGEKMDGWEVENKSEIQHPTHNIPIIAMTAHAMAGDEQKSLEAGMNGHVTKPIDPEQLFATLQRWIRPAAERAAALKSLPASGGPPILDIPPELDRAVPDEDELPESLPGFDLATGLSRLMGNKRLYRKLLLDFGTKYTETAREIRGALDASDFEQAHSLVHNIKGLAGNLAATDLQTSAVNLEKLVKGVTEIPPSAKELTSKISDLEDALNQALTSVQTMHSPAAAGAENGQLSPQTIVAKTPEIPKEDVDRILKAVDNGDFEALTVIAEELKTRSDAYVLFSDKLVELAEDFDFEVIEELVSELESSAIT